MAFIFMALLISNAFGQSQEKIDQKAFENAEAAAVKNKEEINFDLSILQKAQQTILKSTFQNEEKITSASSEIVDSKDPNDFNMFKGTRWSLEYTTTQDYEKIITFYNDVIISDDGRVNLAFKDQYGNIGIMGYTLSGGELIAEAAGIYQPYYFAMITVNLMDPINSTEIYCFNAIGNFLLQGAYARLSDATDFYPLTGSLQSFGTNFFDDDGDGYTENQGDCNDNNNSIYPGAIEICGDGIDQDCNGSDLSCGNPPPAPTAVTASDGTLSGKVQISWNPSTGAESYDIYRADIPAWAGGVPKRIATSVIGTSYDDTSAVSGKQYYYWIKAKNTNGGSGYSMFNPGYWGANGYVPSLPVNVAASDGTVSGKVSITWATVPNAVVYEIYRADYPAYLGGKIKNIGTSITTSYNDATIVNGNQYYYWVKARNSWGVSGYSKFDTGYIGASSALPPAPTGVAATDGNSGKVTLTWNAVSGSLIYEVYRATKPAYEGGVPTLLGTVKSPAVSYNDTAITCGPSYYYWVKSRTSWGSSGYSQFDTGFCTGQ